MAAPSTGGSRIEAKQDRIAHVLSDRLLTVPTYQRSYSWTSDEVEEYWRDLRTAITNREPEYFLGTIVMTPDPETERWNVIDGQQRLATTTMILAAIRNAYLSRSENNKASIVERDYLAKGTLDSDELQPQMHLNAEDDDYFFKSVVLSPGSTPLPVKLHASHTRIQSAFDQIQSWIDQLVSDSGISWSDTLRDMVVFMDKQVQVILVESPNESDAFLIFETLNDRGLDLTISDLLKNYLFRLAGKNRLEAVKSAWISSVANLETPTEDRLFTTFLKHYWSSHIGTVRERDLYRSLRDRITSQAEAVNFATGLHAASRHYSALLNSDHEFWADLGTGARSDVESLLRLNLEQYRPMMLAAMQYFTSTELQRLIRSLVSWSVRGLIRGGLGGGTPERYYTDAAIQIRQGTLKNTDDVYAFLQPTIATDSEFETAFSTARENRAPIARYYLLALESHMLGQSEPELVPNKDENDVNLEHVLPRNPKDADWPAFDPQDVNTWVWRLGNLALLRKSHNARIGNKPFTAKQPILAGSVFHFTKSIASAGDWTSAEIEERQQEMAALAPQIWKRGP